MEHLKGLQDGLSGDKDEVKKKDIRPVVNLPIGENGLFEDTGKYNQFEEAHRRQGFVQLFQYSDPKCGIPRIYDEKGDYDCKDCNKFVEGGTCLLVEGEIDGEHGSCRHWENLDAGDPELNFAKKISKEFADYGVTKNKGFGCHRCEFMVAAKKVDSVGRERFCTQGAFRVWSTGCCALNDAPGMKTEFPESEKDES